MKKTILTCDKCNKEVDKLTEVGAGVREYYYGSHISGAKYTLYQHTAEWCDSCCIEWGVLKLNENADVKSITPEPTLEDFLREIIREEIKQTGD